MRISDLVDVARGLGSARRAQERERWPAARLAEHRQAALERLVAHAAQSSPFWRERLPADPRGVRLVDLPMVDKPTLMERFDEAVTDPRLRRAELAAHLEGLDHDALYAGEFRVMATSGSSGVKGLFVYDRAAWAEILGQFFRYTRWAGVTPKLPRRRVAAVVGGAPTHMSRRISSTTGAVGIHRVLPLPTTLPVDELVPRLNAFQPTFLAAYPSMAAQLAAEQEAGRLRLSLESMSTSSELCPAELAARLERAFGVRSVDFYATTEGLYGSHCGHPDGGIHLFEDRVIVENVDADGAPVPAGEPGSRLLVTNLFNLSQPMIRLELADRVVVDPKPCPCGRTLMRLRAIEGRTDDTLRLNGTTILPLHFAVVTADADVRQFQVVQDGQGVRVRVVLEPAADGDDACRRLRERVTARLAEAGVADPHVVVEPCAALARGEGGKVRMIVAEPATPSASAP